MNSLRLRIFLTMLVTGLVPLSLMTFGLRYLPGGLLPWLLYAVLVAGCCVSALTLSGTLSRPLRDSLRAMVQIMRSPGTSKPAAWVPKEFKAMQDSLSGVLAEERQQRIDAEQRLQELGHATAEAEGAAVRSIAVLSEITEACSEGLVFAHSGGHLALINARARELLPVDEEVSKPGTPATSWLTAVAGLFNDSPTLAATWCKWHTGPGLQEGEWTTKKGRTVAVRTFDVRDPGGVLLGRTWMFTDATVERQMRERLAESQKMESIGQLAGGIAHDFNNLLTAIRGNLTLAELESNPADSRSKIDDASRAAGRAAELVNQILGYSRRTRGAQNLTDVAQVVGEVRNILRASLDPKVALRVNVAKDTWNAAADPVQIEQVLLNLCLNARDALPEKGGSIEITTANFSDLDAAAPDTPVESRSGFVVIRVKDNGQGIPLEVRGRIFEPFFTTKEYGKGTGLGLAMARNIVEQAGGRIEFDSEVGHGTTFSVFLPRSLALPATKSDEQRGAKPMRGQAEGTVLVVDDEAPVRSIAVNMLKYLGYQVIEAGDGEEALHVLQSSSHPVDAVMMDVYMPKLSGRDTYRQMRALGIEVPVIVCSGFMVEPDEFTALAQGRHAPVEVIQKPYSMESLARVVSKAIAKGQQALTA